MPVIESLPIAILRFQLINRFFRNFAGTYILKNYKFHHLIIMFTIFGSDFPMSYPMYLLFIHFFITISFLVFLSYFTSSLFLLLYQVNSLMCYQCESYSSPADCASKEIQTTCVGGSVRCATVEAKYESDSISSLVIVKGLF